MRTISYTRFAIKALRRLPAPMQKRIRAKVQASAKTAALQANNVTVLKARIGIRLRVGDWRVIMDDGGAVLAVLEIGPRGGIYE